MKIKSLFCLILSALLIMTATVPLSVFADDIYVEDNDGYVEEEIYEEENIDAALLEEEFYEEENGTVAQLEEELDSTSENAEEIDDLMVEDVELTVIAAAEASPFEITEDIEKDYNVAVGDTVLIKIVAPGATSYAWKWRSGEGAAWKTLNNTTDTVTFSMLEKYSGRQYQCTVSNGTETLTSGIATVKVPGSGFEITEDIGKDYNVAVGGTVLIKIVAPGATSYAWKWRSGEGAAWKTLNNTTDTVTFSMLEKYSGRQYQCTVSNGTDTLTSGIATVLLDRGDVEIDGIIYAKNAEGVVYVKGYNGTATSYTVLENVPDLGTVTEVGEEAFMDNTNLQSIDLPDTITIIRARAFKGCTSLSAMN